MSFHWGETDIRLGGTTPADLTTKVAPHRVAMRGAGDDPLRCIALEGAVGVRVACRIYAERPSPCREFRASWVDGGHSARCDAARKAHGLRPLERPVSA